MTRRTRKMAGERNCLIVVCLSFLCACLAGIPPYKEQYFEQTIDHFNFKAYGNETYRQRYLIQGTFVSLSLSERRR